MQEKKRASTSMMKILRMIEMIHLIKDFHVRFQKRNQGNKQHCFLCSFLSSVICGFGVNIGFIKTLFSVVLNVFFLLV